MSQLTEFEVPVSDKGEYGMDAEPTRHVRVPARYSHVPGLVVTRETYKEAGKQRIGEWWVLTHRESGRRLGSFAYPSIAEARRAAKAVAPLLDWTLSGEEIHAAYESDSSLKKALRDALAGLAEEAR